MNDWLEEFLIILSQAKRIIFTALMGVFLFMMILVFGYFQIVEFEFQGPLKGLESTIKTVLYETYKSAAFIALVSFWWLAIKQYYKERKRIFGH